MPIDLQIDNINVIRVDWGQGIVLNLEGVQEIFGSLFDEIIKAI